MRNTKMEATGNLNDSALGKYSTKTIEPEKREIIAFEEPDVVFNNSISSGGSQSSFKVEEETGTNDKFKRNNCQLKTKVSQENDKKNST
jgi:hypothetical protein